MREKEKKKREGGEGGRYKDRKRETEEVDPDERGQAVLRTPKRRDEKADRMVGNIQPAASGELDFYYIESLETRRGSPDYTLR